MPAAVRQRAKLVLLDTIGVMLTGAARPEVQGLRTQLVTAGGCAATVLAAPDLPETDTRTAAMLNGLAARAIEMCEGQRGLQPAAHILPAVLAVAEARGLGGRAMLEALVAGYEVAGRLNRGYVARAFSHPNGQLSLLGSAAAGAKLHGLDAAGVSLSLRIATTMLMTPSYTNTVAGATTLNLPAAMGGVAGVLVPAMAEAGYAAQPNAIEEALGTMVGAAFDPAGIAEALGTRWEITDNYFRFYACCNPIHPSLDALAEALSMLGNPKPEQIERIAAETFGFASVMRNQAPPNYFASKYSFPHAAATLVARGGIGFLDIDDTALADPVISALRQRVSMAEDPAMTALGPALKPARVTVTLRDGRSATAACENSRRDMLQEDPEPAVREKFRVLAGTVLPAAAVAAVEQAVDGADEWPGLAPLFAAARRE